MKTILSSIVDVIIALVFIALIIGLVGGIVTTAGIYLPNKISIFHNNPLLVTHISTTVQNSENLCCYVISQKNKKNKNVKQFSYITQCGMYNIGDHLILIREEK